MPTPLQMFMMKSGQGRDARSGGIGSTSAASEANASYGGLEGFEGGGFTSPGLSFGFNPTSAGYSLARSLAFGAPVGPLGLVSAFTNYDPGDTAGFAGYSAGDLPGMPGAPAHQAGFPGAISRADKAARDAARGPSMSIDAGRTGLGKTDMGGGGAGGPGPGQGRDRGRDRGY